MDRADVVRGLECRFENKPGKDCEHCHYGITMGRRWGCDFMRMCGDALELLKAQEAQEAVKPIMDIDTWVCGQCGTRVERQSMAGPNVLIAEQLDFCPNCGRAVKWE